MDANGRLVVAGTATGDGYSSFAVSCYDPGIASLGLQINDVAPGLAVFGNQVTTTGQELDLSPIGRFMHAPVATGDFSYSIDWATARRPTPARPRSLTPAAAPRPWSER